VVEPWGSLGWGIRPLAGGRQTGVGGGVELGAPPETTDYLEAIQGSPTAYVISKNLQRRSLTSSQKATIAVEALPLLEAEAAARRRATEGRPRKDPEKLPERFPEVSDAAEPEPWEHAPEPPPPFMGIPKAVPASDRAEREARTQAAATAGTNPRYVSDAKRLKDEAPDLFEDVRAGEKTIPEAKREAQQRDGGVSPDRGCSFWERCSTCPWRQCLREDLPPAEAARVRGAFRLLQEYVAADAAPRADATPRR
jgi:hypothetical protein